MGQIALTHFLSFLTQFGPLLPLFCEEGVTPVFSSVLWKLLISSFNFFLWHFIFFMLYQVFLFQLHFFPGVTFISTIDVSSLNFCFTRKCKPRTFNF